MKTALLAGLACLGFMTTSAQADTYATSPTSQLTINAGSGLIFNGSGISDSSRHRDYRHSYRHERYDHRDRDNYYDRREGVTAYISTGNVGIYWSEYDNATSRYDRYDRFDGRHDNGNHYGQERREGKYLKDRYGNCYRIEEGRHTDRRVRVSSSRCRF